MAKHTKAACHYVVQADIDYRRLTEAEAGVRRRAIFKFRAEKGLPERYASEAEAKAALAKDYGDAPYAVLVSERCSAFV